MRRRRARFRGDHHPRCLQSGAHRPRRWGHAGGAPSCSTGQGRAPRCDGAGGPDGRSCWRAGRPSRRRERRGRRARSMAGGRSPTGKPNPPSYTVPTMERVRSLVSPVIVGRDDVRAGRPAAPRGSGQAGPILFIAGEAGIGKDAADRDDRTTGDVDRVQDAPGGTYRATSRWPGRSWSTWPGRCSLIRPGSRRPEAGSSRALTMRYRRPATPIAGAGCWSLARIGLGPPGHIMAKLGVGRRTGWRPGGVDPRATLPPSRRGPRGVATGRPRSERGTVRAARALPA